MRAPVLITPPAEWPVSTPEAKAHLRLDGTEEDQLIGSYIEAAVAALDGWSGILGRALMPQVWRQDFDGFRTEMRLPLAPVRSIDEVRYVDAAGANQVFADFVVITDGLGPKLCLHGSLPSIQARSVVEVEFTAGYTDAAAVPAAIRVAILQHVATLWHYRETLTDRAVPTGAYQAMLAPFHRVRL